MQPAHCTRRRILAVMSTASTRQKTLYESATARSRVIRHLDLVCVVDDGGGAMITPTADFVQAQKWAASRLASGTLMTDRGRFFERLVTVVSRPGSTVPTRGNPRQLESVARSMKAAGYELTEWTLPNEIVAPKTHLPQPAKPGAAADGDEGVGDADTPPSA